jgi:hypothetical protein
MASGSWYRRGNKMYLPASNRALGFDRITIPVDPEVTNVQEFYERELSADTVRAIGEVANSALKELAYTSYKWEQMGAAAYAVDLAVAEQIHRNTGISLAELLPRPELNAN